MIEVYIDKSVHRKLTEFYEYALSKYPAID